MALPTMTVSERDAFLAEPRVAVLGLANGDDRPPLIVPIWYHYQPGGNVTFFTGTQGRKARKTDLIQKQGRISLCVQDPEFPYKYVTIEGSVVKADRPPSLEQILNIVRRYLPDDQAHGFAEAELAIQSPEFVLFTIHPERWLTVDLGKAG